MYYCGILQPISKIYVYIIDELQELKFHSTIFDRPVFQYLDTNISVDISEYIMLPQWKHCIMPRNVNIYEPGYCLMDVEYYPFATIMMRVNGIFLWM